MAHLRFLGTGAGYPNPNRCTSSILIEGAQGALLLDAGEGCARRLQEEGQWRQEIRSILLTHNHADHVAGLFMLLLGMKADRRGNPKPLEIWAPKGLREGLESFLPTVRMGEDLLTFPLVLHELKPGKIEAASGHQIEVWPNDHLLADDEGRGGSYSLALELDGRRWVFSGDLGSLNPLEGKLGGTQGLVIETSHVRPDLACATALSEGVERIILTHVSLDTPTPAYEGAMWAHDNLLVQTRESGM